MPNPTPYLKYRAHMRIAGAPWRPPYTGYVDVRAAKIDDVPLRARRKLQRTAFPDVGFDSMYVERIERISR